MTIISLKDFVTTGQFGPVKIGTTKQDVITHFGEPDSDDDFDMGSGRLMYACYEFFYNQENLTIDGIQNDHLTTWPGRGKKKLHQESICFQNEKIKIDIWFLKVGQDITYGEVKNMLRAEQIPFEEISNEDQGHLIKFKSGVTMDFDDRSGMWVGEKDGSFKPFQSTITDLENQLLNGIRLFDLS